VLVRVIPSPVGALELYASERGLSAVLFQREHKHALVLEAEPAPATAKHEVLNLAARELGLYFKKKLTSFTVPLDPHGGTPFQREVWNALREIPFGETRSYGFIAERIRRPKAVRAVGAANGRNPLSIVVPCHRVIGANGTLTGYAGGLDVKKWLVAHEER
jgi:methylated-DNA-[protein]-cysteine S-methyltransferase